MDCISELIKIDQLSIINAISNNYKYSNEDLIILNCEAYQSQFNTLIDTGATSNYMSEDALRNMVESAEANDKPLVVPCKKSVKVAHNSTIDALGLVQIKLFFIDRVINVPFIILKNLVYDLIIGMQCLKQNGVVIDAEDGHIGFKSKNNDEQSLLTNKETIVIPPYCQVVANAYTNKCYQSPQLVQNYEPFNIKQGCYIAQGPVTNSGHTLNILLNNLTATEKTIKPGTTIGLLEPIKNNSELTGHTIQSWTKIRISKSLKKINQILST